ncbi:uncharacterized protein LOC119979506 isoform X3 [Scyliorhinus canicula]|uniref:uncharacterized protein LOC119979506 isoform X3 n=1 Tax=Scyliorhinus canicula TaxID=7830 RepID=UPI0018F5CBF2|nr:uncharacterized protein LOC119979506 isoform X3 [Scyliorhinus canicula]
MMNRDKRSRRRDTPKRGSSKRMTRFTLGTFLVTRDYNKVQENLTMRASAESRGLTADLCHTSPTTCNGKVRQNMERPYLENSTRQSAKHVGFKKEMHSQRLVQTNLAYTSQSLRQPMKPLLLAAVSSHKQQSNVEHHRQKHSSSDSITDRGRSISLAASKHFVRAQERYLSNSGTLTSINFNMSFDEVKTGTSKKQKKYFAHGEENLSQIQLSSQEAGDSHFKVSASQYESLIIGSPNRPVTPGNLANVYRPSLDRRSNTLRSILKSSQTSASLHRSMLSLGDSNYKAKHASRETASISPLRFSTYNTVNLPSGDGKEEWSSEAYSNVWKHQNVPIIPNCDSFLANNNRKGYYPVWDACPLCLRTKYQSTEPRGFPLDGGWTKRPVKRYLKLYHHRLLLRCLSAWNCFAQQRYAAAVSLQERQLLRKGLHALHWAVQFSKIQEKLLERRQRARLLAHSFKRWTVAARPSQCQLVTGAPNTTDKFCTIHPRKPVTLQLIRTKTYKLWRNQQEAAQLLSLASLHGHACFDAWARFCGQKIACQQALERRQIESLRSFFLQWRSMLQLKRGENLHLFQLCHTQTHQQTTDWPELQLFASTESSNPANSTPSSRVSRWRLVHSTENPVVQAFACWSHGKDDVFIQDGVSETCVEAENIQVSCREPRSLDGICPDETLQDWRKDTYKVQLNRIPTCSRLQDALQLWPAEPFQHHLRFSKHLPQQDCTVTLVDTEGSSDTNCSCPEQGTELRPHRLHETIPANRVDLEKAGKWLQHKVEKHLVEQHLACWVAQFRQVRRVERFHQWSLLARAFLSWSQWRQGRCRTRELIERFSFVRQCRVLLSLWKMRLLQKLEADRRCREILHQQIQKAMTQWHTYTRNRRQLYDLQAYFQSVKKQKVKLLILSNWQQKAERQRDMKIVADGMVQRRYLQAWYLVTLRIEERKQNLWAFQTGQTRQTLWRVFSWWKYCCELRCYSEYHRQLQTAQRAVHCWKQKMLLGRAIRHRHTIITQIFFRSWKETVRLFQLSYQFAVNIEERRLRLLLNAWANLVKERKTVDAQLRLMISAAQQRVMQAAFHQMVALYRKQKEVVKFYHLTLLRRSLLSWAEFVHQQKQWVLTVSSQVSVLQLRSVFVMWMNQLTLHRKLILMVQKRNEQILQKALRSWYKEMQAVRHHSRYVSQKFVSRWVLNVLARKPENLRNGVEYQAEEHYRNQLCKQFLIIWWHKTLLQQFREKKRVEEMQAIWEQWKGFTVNMLVTRGLCQQRLEGKAWQMWRRRFIQTQVSRAFAAQDDRILMSDVFTAWYSLTVVKREGAE